MDEANSMRFSHNQEDCTASRWRCSKNTWRLTSSVKITSDPAAISFALLYVADGFNFAKRNLACSAWAKWCYPLMTNLQLLLLLNRHVGPYTLHKATIFKQKNAFVTWEPCWSHTTSLGTGNLSWMIAWASSWGTCNSCLNAWIEEKG